MKRIHTKAKPMLIERYPIADQVESGDGCRLVRGRSMRMPARFSKSLQTTVPSRVGCITDIYRRGDDPRVLVDLVNGPVTYTVDGAACRRSAACPEGT